MVTKEGLVTGTKVSKVGLMVSHLLFTDDSNYEIPISYFMEYAYPGKTKITLWKFLHNYVATYSNL